MTAPEKISRLVDETLDDFDSPDQTVTGLLRRCTRIASLRNDFTNLIWLEMEAMDITSGKSAAVSGFGPRMLMHMDQEEANVVMRSALADFVVRRSPDKDKDEMLNETVEAMEERVRSATAAAEAIDVPDGMHPVDLYRRSEQKTQLRVQTELALRPTRRVLARVKSRLHSFLVETEQQLGFGKVNADVFERLRNEVDTVLGELAPDVLSKFNAAAKAARDDDPESLTHALTSCRRVLKATADVVYPSDGLQVTGADGKVRVMTDDAYTNRLIQAVSAAVGKHGDGAVVQATLNVLGGRLTTLNALASKGVHGDVTRAEVDTCVVQTYLMVGDVLRLTTGRSGAMIDVSDAG